jgi:outer membrane protein insertion porin family
MPFGFWCKNTGRGVDGDMRITWLLLLLLLAGLIPGTSSAQDEVDEKLFDPYWNLPIINITLAGNKITKEHVITRELTLEVGDSLTLDAVKESVQNLMNLDIFSSVTVTPTLEAEGVAIDFTVREMPWIIPYIKLKYNEENGWSIGPTVSSLNLFGRGIKLSAFWLFGGTNTFSFIGSWPWSYQFEPWIGTFIGKPGRLKGTVSWFQMNSDSAGRTLEPDNQDNFIMVAGSIGYDTRDSWTNPTRGWHNELLVGKFGDPLPGDGDSWRVILDLRRYQSLTKRQALAFGSLASMNTGTVGVAYPEYLMYRMGGANSIRGYNLDELGPILFGQNQIILTAEYQYMVMPFREYKIWKWPFRAGLQLAAFADWGNAWNEGQSLRDRGRFGAGVGIRAMVPAVNMVRFDFGVSEDGDVVFNFGIHAKFDAQRDRLR